jgi:hypothetical protein
VSQYAYIYNNRETVHDDPQHDFDCETIAKECKAMTRIQTAPNWDDYNDDDGCGWSGTEYEPTDLTDPGWYGVE